MPPDKVARNLSNSSSTSSVAEGRVCAISICNSFISSSTWSPTSFFTEATELAWRICLRGRAVLRFCGRHGILRHDGDLQSAQTTVEILVSWSTPIGVDGVCEERFAMLIECDRAEPTGAPNDVLSAKRISLEGSALPIALARRNSDACQSRGRGWRRSRADLPAQVGRFPGARSSRRLGYGRVWGVRRVPSAPARRSISATGNPGARTPFQASPDLASTRSRGCCWPAMSQASGTRVPRYRHSPACFPTAPVSICRASPTELPGTLPTTRHDRPLCDSRPAGVQKGRGIRAAPDPGILRGVSGPPGPPAAAAACIRAARPGARCSGSSGPSTRCGLMATLFPYLSLGRLHPGRQPGPRYVSRQDRRSNRDVAGL